MTYVGYGFDLTSPEDDSGRREHHISFRDSQLTIDFQYRRHLPRI